MYIFGKTKIDMKPYPPTHLPNELKKLKSVYWVISTFLLLASCDEKMEIHQKSDSSDDALEYRSMSNEEIDSLISFQTYLNDIKNHVQRTNTYSLSRAIYGVEALLNIRYADSQKGVSMYTASDTITVQTNSDWFDLYEGALDNLLGDMAFSSDTNIVLAAFDISVDTVIGSNILILTKSIFKNISQSTISKYDAAPLDCGTETFGENEEYYLWLGGTDVLPLYQGSELDCEIGCGSVAPGTTAAMEEIQHHINASYPDPDCGPGRIWSGKFIDINYNYSLIEWSYNLFEECGVPENTAYQPCDCLNADILNCMLCTIYEEIDTYTSPIRIPEYNHFISIDLGVDFIYSNPIEEADTRIDIKYFYGVPVCTMTPVDYTDSVLTMDLEELKCC